MRKLVIPVGTSSAVCFIYLTILDARSFALLAIHSVKDDVIEVELVKACQHPLSSLESPGQTEKGILLSMYASCKPTEEANSITFSVRGTQNDKNTGTMSYWINDEELHKTQHTFGKNFTTLRCGRTSQDPCSFTTPEWFIWSKGITLLGNYVLIVDDEETIRAFKAALENDTIDLNRYGQILKSGWGKIPPNEVTDEIEKQYVHVYK